MGLGVNSVHLLTLTRRKADCERGISATALRKQALSREMTQLTRDYQSKISKKQVVYYDGGSYHKINYGYLMGYGNWASNLDAIVRGNKPLKDNNKMILADYQGRVVLANDYAKAIMLACGVGMGESFSESKFPDILNKLIPMYSADEYRDGISSYTWDATTINPITGETGTTEGDSTEYVNDNIQKIIDFFYPMLKSAMVNGWTTEYNDQMAKNDNYLTDALSSGSLILVETNEYGYYDENASLTYFATAGDIELKTDTDVRKELEVWYNAEKERIAEKETYMDMTITDLSTELEAIKTEIESVKSFIDDATQTIFNWGNG